MVTATLQWILPTMDTTGTKTVVLISEVSLFQRENIMYLYEVGTGLSVLINQGVLYSRVFFIREVPLYTC